IYDNGEYTELIPPGWISAAAYNINNGGVVIGTGTDGNGNNKGYIYHNGQYTELLPPGWLDAVPEDIDDSGAVAGYGTDGDVVRGFVYTDGAYIVVTSPDSNNTAIIGINNNREVVGLSYNPARGFVSVLCPNPPVRTLGAVSAYYSSLQDAYDNAADGDVIQAHNIIFSGSLRLDLNKTVTISGGYDCEYTEVSGTSRLNGDVVIASGKTTIENVVSE
ncbi:MAG: hypothetical protein AB1499_10190, partial [Nitrospirota bacterium]